MSSKIICHQNPSLLPNDLSFTVKPSENETVMQYLTELRQLSESCASGGFLEKALRDRFVSSLHDSVTQRKLLSEADLILTLSQTTNFRLFHTERV